MAMKWMIELGVILLVLLCLSEAVSAQEAEHHAPAFSVTAAYAVTAPGVPRYVGGQFAGQDGQEAGRQHPPSEGQEATPPVGLINCQDQQTLTEEEQIERQEQAARDLDKAVVGLEIAQGAIEITLGAIRIAAAATTADVLRRQDAIASSRAAASAVVGFEGRGITPEPIRFRDDPGPEPERKPACIRRSAQFSLADDPFSTWSNGYHQRMKRSSLFGPMIISEEAHNFVKPTPDPKADAYPVKLPNTEEAEHLLGLLENLLDTNNEVLHLLGIDLPPLTNQPSNPGAILLRQYRKRVEYQRELQRKYGEMGFLDEKTEKELLHHQNSWKGNVGRRSDVRTLSSELSQLNRMRRRFSLDG